MTNTDFLRQRLLDRCGICERKPMPALDILREREWSPEFERLMRNRLVMGALRYGGIRAKKIDRHRYIDSIGRRLASYLADGNSEHLVDVANLCLVLFESSDHPNHHFATGDGTEHC
jgi:hypothetical protein